MSLATTTKKNAAKAPSQMGKRVNSSFSQTAVDVTQLWE